MAENGSTKRKSVESLPKKDDSKKAKFDPKKNNKKKAFIYGNYDKYYGYRLLDHSQKKEDPRLAVFKKEWFEGKECLDIGCNRGLITMTIAKKFHCQRILGIDIDAGLIGSANRNLRELAGAGKNSKPQVSGSSADCLKQEVSQGSDAESCTCVGEASTSKNESYIGRVSFKRENFVESMQGCSETYDTILCLSVTKWIHLNWGDDGLITLFAKIWRLLRPGGIFVLEPQPWSSYRKNRLVSETATVNFSSILIQPHIFHEILLDKIGFRSAEIVTDSLSGTVAGFDRPIMAFVK